MVVDPAPDLGIVKHRYPLFQRVVVGNYFLHSHCHLMAESAAAPRDVVASTGKEVAKVEEYIPEVIEERRRDAEGRVLAFRYARGKLLGKVS